ncbi:MAG: peptidoglycan DD-metalloendopeptidase family protein [Alphaproteobacteria bacterium]|nr:peptidoglycan DD-metalloendopeptidase family protein [Alphaproteobacteria bacterium]
MNGRNEEGSNPRARAVLLRRRPLALAATGMLTVLLGAAVVSAHMPAQQSKGQIRAVQDRVVQAVLDLTEGYLRFAPDLMAPTPPDIALHAAAGATVRDRALDPIAPLRFGVAPDADGAIGEPVDPPLNFDFRTGADKAETSELLISRTFAVGKGDTLMKLLSTAGADAGESAEAVSALRKVFDVKRLQLGQEITLTFRRDDEQMRLEAINLAPSVERQVAVARTGDGAFKANETLVPLAPRLARAGGVIDDSLFQTAQRANIPPGIIADMIRIFSFDVDFQREVQKGDSFQVMFERLTDEQGRVAKEGNITFASMTLSGQVLRYFRYQPSDDRDADYFTEKGQSVRKALLRTPIDGARLTSGFGMRRHPILGYTAQHKGVDFAAAVGTPIMAAGDGTVEMAGWNGAYGKYVRIRHNSNYSTAYAHLSRFASDLRQGQRIRQGQTIGYVGTTGRSTGPHLHYEVLINNSHVNPLSVRLPTGRNLEGKELLRFRSQIEETLAALNELPLTTRLAQN